MRSAHSTVVVGLIFVLAIASAGSAQIGTGVVRGQVVDGSGAVLPGVTLVATGADGRVRATVVTDEVGRYLFPALPEGPTKLTFELAGFDTASIDIVVRAGVESWVIERLRLAQIKEQVIVYGKVPDPPLVAPTPLRRPVPQVIPLATEELESICQPAKAAAAPESLGIIQSHLYEPGRTLYAKGDELIIDGGTENHLEVGRNLVVRRYYRVNPASREPVLGEHTAGLVQIVAASERRSTAVIVHACNEVMKGDHLAAFAPQRVQTPHPSGTPDFDDAMRILFADAGQLLGSPHRLLVIDRGSGRGIEVGQRLTLFRGRPSTPPVVIGEAIVIAVRTHSATIRIERAIDAISFDDWAAPQLPSPLEPTAKVTPPSKG